MEASKALFAVVRVPVSASVVVIAVPRIPRTETRAALASPTTVEDVAAGGDGSGGGGTSAPSSARPAAGHISRIVARATAMEQRPRAIVRCMQSSLSWHLTHI